MSAFRVGPNQAEVIDVKSLSGVHMKLVKTVRIHPYAMWRQIWGGLITLLLVYNMIVLPIAVGFVLNDSPGTFTMNRIIDVFFIIDIFLNFETGIVLDDTTTVEMERNRVRSSYLRGAFVVDFISAIPLDVILIYGFNQRYMTDVRDIGVGVESIVVRLIVRGMKILRLLKSINIMKAFDRFEKAAVISLDAAEFVRFFIVTFFVLHWAACIFAFIDSNVCPQDPYYSAFVANGINDWTYLDRYVAAFYWALQTVVTIGYGDMNARCTASRCFALSVMFLGSVGYAYGISMVMNAMQKQREKHREMKELMVSVEEYANFIKLPTSLRVSVREYFAFINARNEFIHEKLILDQLSPDLKGLVLHHVNSNLITSVRLFTFLSEIEPEPRHLVVDVIAALQTQVLRPDEVVIAEGDKSSNFYVVSKGALCMFKWNVLKLDTIEAGKSFGEACFLAPYLTPFVASQSSSAVGAGRQFINNHDDNASEVGDVIELTRTQRGDWTSAKSIDILEGRQVHDPLSKRDATVSNGMRAQSDFEAPISLPHRGESASFTSINSAISNTNIASEPSANLAQPDEIEHSAAFIRAARRFSSAIFRKPDAHDENNQAPNAAAGGQGKGIKRRVSISQQMTGRIHGLVEQAEKVENGVTSYLGGEAPSILSPNLADPGEVERVSTKKGNNVDFIDGYGRSDSGIIDVNGQNSSNSAFRSSASSLAGLGGSSIDLGARSVSGSIDDVYYQPYTIIATTYTGVRFLPQKEFDVILRRYDRAKRKVIKRALRDRCIDVMDKIAAYEDELAEKFPAVLQKYISDLARLAAVENLLEGTPWDLSSLRARTNAVSGEERQDIGRLGRAQSVTTPPHHEAEGVMTKSAGESFVSDAFSLKVRRSMSNIRGLVGVSADAATTADGLKCRDEPLNSSEMPEGHLPHHSSASGISRTNSGAFEFSPNVHASLFSEKPTARAISRADIIANPSTLSRVFAPPLSSVDEGYVKRLRKLSNATAPVESPHAAGEPTDTDKCSFDEGIVHREETTTAENESPKHQITTTTNQSQGVRDSPGSGAASTVRDSLAADVEMVRAQIPDDPRSMSRFFDLNGIPRHQTDPALGVGMEFGVDMRFRQVSYTPKRTPASDITDILREDGLSVSAGRNPLAGRSRDEARAAADELLELSPIYQSPLPTLLQSPQLNTTDFDPDSGISAAVETPRST